LFDLFAAHVHCQNSHHQCGHASCAKQLEFVFMEFDYP